jgi:hypothetical protein
MNNKKDEKWLDELIAKTINGTRPEFDARTWKQKHPEEYRTLVSRTQKPRPVAIAWYCAAGFTAAAAAAVIIVAALLAVYSRPTQYETPPIQVAGTSKSPAEMLTWMSLNTAYRKGGLNAVDKECEKALESLQTRQLRLSVEDVLAELNGT